jgi:transcription-repair coupling factor (superfamily II helicase)
VSKLGDVPRLFDETAGIGVRLSQHSVGQDLAVSGVWGSLRGVFAAAIARHASNILMLLPEAADADVVAGDAAAFGLADVASLPLSASEASASSIRDDDYADRLQVLQRLVARDADSAAPLLVTAYIGGAMQLVPTPEKLEASTRRIAVGDELEPETIRRWLAESGFSATTAVQLSRFDVSTLAAKEVSNRLSRLRLRRWGSR